MKKKNQAEEKKTEKDDEKEICEENKEKTKTQTDEKNKKNTIKKEKNDMIGSSLKNLQETDLRNMDYKQKKIFMELVNKYYSPLSFDKNSDKGYIYLVRTGSCKKFIPDGCEVFKVGKSTNILQRMSFYIDGHDGENMDLVFCIFCEKNLSTIEYTIMQKLKNCGNFDWEKKNGFGNEFFSGEISRAVKIITDIVEDKEGFYDWYTESANGKWYNRDLFDEQIKSALPKIIYKKENAELRKNMRC
jgi:hypothetical protein